ncbi:hypothetical protein [Argonema galeatum]|uniref:hypothetical protein n=1 Tax=Argonema galeatum TaxID=2942762 RepID=UPI0020117560|nr:hypothetical protein [Argonema galeatum]MCL1466460.1 hypothetical protein [Argonema galeatum A003/A1]
MHFLINELSFIGQAETKYDADDIIKTLVNLIVELEPIRGDNPIQSHSSFANCKLSVDYSVKQWIYEKLKSPKEQKIADLLLRIISNNGFFIDRTLNELLDYCECYFNQRDVSESSLAGAAHLNGSLISLQNAAEFACEEIQVRFSSNGEIYEDKNIPNLTTVSQASKLRLRYVPSPKHAPGGWGTLMDLNDEIAQKVLDKGIVSGKQIYGYHEGKFYEFQPDGADGFHGYPIDRNEVPSKVLKQVQDLGEA